MNLVTKTVNRFFRKSEIEKKIFKSPLIFREKEVDTSGRV